EADKTKIREGTKEVNWERFFDHNDEFSDLFHEDYLHHSDGNRGSQSKDVGSKYMEAGKVKICDAMKEVYWETFFDQNDHSMDSLCVDIFRRSYGNRG
ncbi:hypothetical protein Ancab_001364, partial [Ancistrocladus abbreviatus]